MRFRLSLLMFLQYAPAGAVLPTYSRQLAELQFTPLEIAWCCATQAIASIVGPLVAGQLADRYFPAQRCLTCCAVVAGSLLVLLADLTEPLPVFVVTLGFWVAISPVFTLGTALSFAHLPHPERQFGPVRMWGTVGWVSAAALLGLWCILGHLLADSFPIGALLCFVLAAYSLTLPHTPPRRKATTWLAPLGAMRLLRRRPFAVYFALIFVLYVTLPFATQVTPLLLHSLGVSNALLPWVLMVNQSVEIPALFLLPVMLRCGVRNCMILGLLAWLTSMSLQALGHPLGLVVTALVMNGLFITGFVVAGQVYLNRHAHGEIRASAQALLVCVMGIGLLAGNLLVGGVRQWTDGSFSATFGVAAAITLTALVAFVFGFATEEEEDEAAPVVGPVTHGATLHMRVEKTSADR